MSAVAEGYMRVVGVRGEWVSSQRGAEHRPVLCRLKQREKFSLQISELEKAAFPVERHRQGWIYWWVRRLQPPHWHCQSQRKQHDRSLLALSL